ncbi:MAG: ABC transporter ATP-binding protein [bacterium]|jgi:putative ABC transport system ATP-binding protein
MAIIEAIDLEKTYKLGSVEVPALRGVSFSIEPGEFVAIMGPSGSGKSTLLNILGCLDRPTGGRFMLLGKNAGRLGDTSRSHLRNHTIGFVFQSFNLLPKMTALRNVMLPLTYSAHKKNARSARELLAQVGLEKRMHHSPLELSGGEQQRVAIARALVNDPPIVIGDEPTGNLDTSTGKEIMSVFQQLNKAGKTIIIVTHEPEIAEYAHRTLKFRDGLIESDTKLTTPSEMR